jgi:hypothetical protein
VSTAIPFYDIQDHLNVDQPSKAMECLISAAGDDLPVPSLDSSFLLRSRRGLLSADRRRRL